MGDHERIHEILCRVKDIAIELERVPTKQDLINYGITRHEVIKLFGGQRQLLAQCGMKPETKKKIDNSIFNRNIDTHLEQYTPREELEPFTIKFKNARIALISDIHWPFSSKKVINTFFEFLQEHGADFVIINGDAWDMYSHSKYPRSMNVFTPKEEQDRARKMNEEFWQKVKSICPNARCFQLLGNHDIRPLKKVLESYPEAEDWVKEKLKNLFTFEGVETIHDPRQELIINEDVILHGYRSKAGDHRDYVLMNCHTGHTHHGSTVFRRVKGKIIFESNSGTAGDIESKGLSYTPQKMTGQTNGFSYRDKWGPRFVPVDT